MLSTKNTLLIKLSRGEIGLANFITPANDAILGRYLETNNLFSQSLGYWGQSALKTLRSLYGTSAWGYQIRRTTYQK